MSWVKLKLKNGKERQIGYGYQLTVDHNTDELVFTYINTGRERRFPIKEVKKLTINN